MYSVERRNSWLPSIFSNLFDDDFTVMPARQFASPAVNIKESEKDFQIEIAAPGMNKEDFSVRVDNDEELVKPWRRRTRKKRKTKRVPPISVGNSLTLRTTRASRSRRTSTWTASRPR